MQPTGRTALVTGGGSGIGLGIATALAADGWRVAIAGRREQVLQQASASWSGTPSILHHRVDVADRDSVHRLFEWVKKSLGPIDLLINAAGVNVPDRSMADMAPEVWDQVMAINATGVYNCMQAVLPEMRQRRCGLVINIGSIGGKRAAAIGGVAYSASKFAVTALSTAVSNEVAEDGVRITHICPGEVNTPLLDQRPSPPSAEHRAAVLKPEDLGELVVCIANLPPRVHVPDVVIKPLVQEYV